jgi:hypothetical protein
MHFSFFLVAKQEKRKVPKEKRNTLKQLASAVLTAYAML